MPARLKHHGQAFDSAGWGDPQCDTMGRIGVLGLCSFGFPYI